MIKYIVHFFRLSVGSLFIFSGLIKINDPIGFSFKLEEYFGPTVFNIDFLIPIALPVAIFIVIFEVVLGIFLLLGFKKKFTLWSLLLMIIFFTFLTWYSAYFNKVTDCGCFGDAIKLKKGTYKIFINTVNAATFGKIAKKSVTGVGDP